MTLDLLNTIQSVIAAIIKDTEWEKHVYLVGGCVRDKIMQRPIHDIDLAVDIRDGGIKFVKWLEKHYFTSSETGTRYFMHWGTAKFSLRCFHTHTIDCSQTRKYNNLYDDNGVVDTFGTITEDAMRRDLTINALYVNISTGELVDPTGLGLDDIKNHIIRPPQTASLDILRTIRFAIGLGWGISPDIMEEIKLNVGKLAEVENKRLIKDAYNIIKLDNKEHGLRIIEKNGAMKYVESALKQAEVMIKLGIPNGITYICPRKTLYPLKKSLLLSEKRTSNEDLIAIRDFVNNENIKYRAIRKIKKALENSTKIDAEIAYNIVLIFATISDGTLRETAQKIIENNSLLQLLKRTNVWKYIIPAIARSEYNNSHPIPADDDGSIDDSYVYVLRSIRLAVMYNMDISPVIMDTLERDANILSYAYKGKMRKEVQAILKLDNKERALRLLEQVGAMKYIKPIIAKIEANVKRGISSHKNGSERKKRCRARRSSLTYNSNDILTTKNVLRSVYSFVKVGFKISPETMAELKKNVGLIAEKDHKTLRKEVKAIIELEAKERALQILERIGAMQYINSVITELCQ